MIQNNKTLLKKHLLKLKKEYSLYGLKASLEDEGIIFDEVIHLRDLCTSVNIFLSMKIGGCEAISNLRDCLKLGVDNIIAPMIESKYAAKKFCQAINGKIPQNQQDKLNYLLLIESITAHDNIEDILKSVTINLMPGNTRISGIVVGRSDLTMSFDKPKDQVDSDFISSKVEHIFKTAKKLNLTTTMGGNISVKSENFIKKLYQNNLLDKIETRNVILKLNENNINNLPEAIEHALTFESCWLKTKSEYYKQIGLEYDTRSNLLAGRK